MDAPKRCAVRRSRRCPSRRRRIGPLVRFVDRQINGSPCGAPTGSGPACCLPDRVKRPMPSLETQVLDVGGACLRYPQPVQPEQHRQRGMIPIETLRGEQECAKLAAELCSGSYRAVVVVSSVVIADPFVGDTANTSRPTGGMGAARLLVRGRSGFTFWGASVASPGEPPLVRRQRACSREQLLTWGAEARKPGSAFQPFVTPHVLDRHGMVTVPW